MRRDPMAMLPFCGYNMADYWEHWFEMGEKLGDKAPKIFNVNWFRTDDEGNFIWPGFGDNLRVLEWIIKRCEGKADAEETPIGFVPKAEDINLEVGRARVIAREHDDADAHIPQRADGLRAVGLEHIRDGDDAEKLTAAREKERCLALLRELLCAHRNDVGERRRGADEVRIAAAERLTVEHSLKPVPAPWTRT